MMLLTSFRARATDQNKKRVENLATRTHVRHVKAVHTYRNKQPHTHAHIHTEKQQPTEALEALELLSRRVRYGTAVVVTLLYVINFR